MRDARLAARRRQVPDEALLRLRAYGRLAEGARSASEDPQADLEA